MPAGAVPVATFARTCPEFIDAIRVHCQWTFIDSTQLDELEFEEPDPRWHAVLDGDRVRVAAPLGRFSVWLAERGELTANDDRDDWEWIEEELLPTLRRGLPMAVRALLALARSGGCEVWGLRGSRLGPAVRVPAVALDTAELDLSTGKMSFRDDPETVVYAVCIVRPDPPAAPERKTTVAGQGRFREAVKARIAAGDLPKKTDRAALARELGCSARVAGRVWNEELARHPALAVRRKGGRPRKETRAH
jgi:hypothetical protein